jgi:hypothetical protein
MNILSFLESQYICVSDCIRGTLVKSIDSQKGYVYNNCKYIIQE